MTITRKNHTKEFDSNLLQNALTLKTMKLIYTRLYFGTTFIKADKDNKKAFHTLYFACYRKL